VNRKFEEIKNRTMKQSLAWFIRDGFGVPIIATIIIVAICFALAENFKNKNK
jgi:hypothetical protein